MSVKNKEEEVKKAAKDVFVKNYVVVKGICKTLELVLNPKDYETVKDIVSNSILNGKLNSEEKKILSEKLTGLKPEVKERIIGNIVNGEKLFLGMLHKEMSKGVPGELEILGGILDSL